MSNNRSLVFQRPKTVANLFQRLRKIVVTVSGFSDNSVNVVPIFL